MSGFQKGATYEQLKVYVLDHTGLKVRNLYIAQVQQKCGIIERENCYGNTAHMDILRGIPIMIYGRDGFLHSKSQLCGVALSI